MSIGNNLFGAWLCALGTGRHDPGEAGAYPGRMVTVRRAEHSDIPEIVRLKGLLMEDGWPWHIELDDAWRERCAAAAATLLDSPNYACFVIDAEEGAGPGTPLASIVSTSVEQHLPGPDGSGRSAYLGDMSTDLVFRGRGYGKTLLDAALAWCREQDAGWVSLFSTESGHSLYRKAGFSPVGPFQHMSMGLD